jgi:protein tyrosine phosphatase
MKSRTMHFQHHQLHVTCECTIAARALLGRWRPLYVLWYGLYTSLNVCSCCKVLPNTSHASLPHNSGNQARSQHRTLRGTLRTITRCHQRHQQTCVAEPLRCCTLQVLVHCWGGGGRTGIAQAAYLLLHIVLRCRCWCTAGRGGTQYTCFSAVSMHE